MPIIILHYSLTMPRSKVNTYLKVYKNSQKTRAFFVKLKVLLIFLVTIYDKDNHSIGNTK